MKKSLIALLLTGMLLAGCGSTPENTNQSTGTTNSSSSESSQSSESSITTDSSETSASEETSETLESEESPVIDESSLTSSETSESSDSLGSSESSESSTSPYDPPVPGAGAWNLNYTSIPETAQSQYNLDFDFKTYNGRGEECGFHGSYLQRGHGSKNGISVDKTIQMKKYDEDTDEFGYMYTTTARAYYLRIFVLKIHSFYGGEDHDFTGVPTLYTGENIGLTGGEAITMDKEELEENGIICYSAILRSGEFRVENRSQYAMYIVEVNYPE